MGTQDFIKEIRSQLGTGKVLVGERRTARFRKGFRSGEGAALAVLTPKTLVEFWVLHGFCCS